MPNLKNRLPRKCNDRGRAFSWHKGKRIYHGVWGSPEADQSYKRFIATLLENPALPLRMEKDTDVLVSELAAGFLEANGKRFGKTNLDHFKRTIGHLAKLYGELAVADFSPKKLKVVRTQMVKSGSLVDAIRAKSLRRQFRIKTWYNTSKIIPGAFPVQIITDLSAFPEALQGGAISIGKFDGMHLGHSLIVQRLKSYAHQQQRPAILVTFDPLPAVLLQPDADIKPICTLERKIELIRNFHVDAVVVIPTTQELLQQSAETFFYETIQDRFHAQVVVAGRDFSFGRDRIGTPDVVSLYGQWTGIEVDIVDPLQMGEERVSSSGIRRLIQSGQIERVNELMPMPYRMTGTVIGGEQRGRTLGFPTANLGNVQTILPKPGVYATVAWIDGRRYGSTTHLGTNPTFDVEKAKIEVFVHDFDGDLYGQQINVDFLALLREPMRFDSPGALVRQMQEDVLRSGRISGGT
ncbi:MAG: riboflavin biosynthesis protein RibF [Planctomycetaceae bacterium]|jgi:riboflavin kinase/FMN adenylyltransferase|nr:riboflavin biosynthesis protein RibF [Planctomycetaceae bacterium]